MDADEKQWLDYQRSDVVRILRDRGWATDEAQAQMDALPDEVFQIIRSRAVNELAECYITGMRSTIRIREVMNYSKRMYPEDTELSIETRRARNESLAALSRRRSPGTVGRAS